MPPDRTDATGRPSAFPGRADDERLIIAWRDGVVARRLDRLAGEEPMAIRVAGPGGNPVDVAITMRTPGDDEELAVGFLVSEGLLAPGDVASVELADPGGVGRPDNEILVRTRTPFDASVVPARVFVASASCGICGKASLDDVALRCPPATQGPVVRPEVLLALPTALREGQAVFDRTGGLHAAGAFAPDGRLLAVREDIGRHNALDKLIGAAALAGELPASGRVLLVSGRVSFEIAQKAAMAGFPILAAVSAPSDLAAGTAERLGMTLVGFLRDGGFNVYTGEERIALG